MSPIELLRHLLRVPDRYLRVHCPHLGGWVVTTSWKPRTNEAMHVTWVERSALSSSQCEMVRKQWFFNDDAVKGLRHHTS